MKSTIMTHDIDPRSSLSAPDRLRQRLGTGAILPFIGIYDVFSATLAARRFDGLFCSGYSFAASHYGLPDVGHMTWSDMVGFVGRLRTILPDPHILVDIDDGFGDPEVASDVIRRLEMAGASAVMMEDQKRPKKCGHLDGKQLVPLEEYLLKLRVVLERRTSMVVLARTDAVDPVEALERATAFVETGADAVMIEGIRDLDALEALHARAEGTPIAVNLIFGGKTEPRPLSELQAGGAGIAIYSTPCLFAAQEAVESTLDSLIAADGLLTPEQTRVSLADNDAVLRENAARRFGV